MYTGGEHFSLPAQRAVHPNPPAEAARRPEPYRYPQYDNGLRAVAREGLESAHVGMPLAYEGMRLARAGMRPAYEGMRLTHEGTRLPYEGMRLAQEGMRPAHEGMEGIGTLPEGPGTPGKGHGGPLGRDRTVPWQDRQDCHECQEAARGSVASPVGIMSYGFRARTVIHVSHATMCQGALAVKMGEKRGRGRRPGKRLGVNPSGVCHRTPQRDCLSRPRDEWPLPLRRHQAAGPPRSCPGEPCLAQGAMRTAAQRRHSRQCSGPRRRV